MKNVFVVFLINILLMIKIFSKFFGFKKNIQLWKKNYF